MFFYLTVPEPVSNDIPHVSLSRAQIPQVSHLSICSHVLKSKLFPLIIFGVGSCREECVVYVCVFVKRRVCVCGMGGVAPRH